MQPGQLEEIVLAAGRSGTTGDGFDVSERIDRALTTVDDSFVRASLLLAKAVALQGATDLTDAVEAAKRAVSLFEISAKPGHAAAAAAVAAVTSDRRGNVADAVDSAVNAMVLINHEDADTSEAQRAANALALPFAQLSAFELAQSFALRATQDVIDSPPDEFTEPKLDAYSHCLAMVTMDGLHTGADLDIQPAIEATERLLQSKNEETRSLIDVGMATELALLAEDSERAPQIPWRLGDATELQAQLESGTAFYEDAGDRVVAWHQLVRAMVARYEGDFAGALVLLDPAIAFLEAGHDGHRLVRGLSERATVLAASGSFAAAYEAAMALQQLVRRRKVRQVGELAVQISRRAEGERVRTMLRQRNDQMAHQMSQDPVTGAYTRRYLEQRFDEFEQAEGSGAVIVVDLDRFKSVNDTFGHHVGDEVLARVGRLLTDSVRATDPVARYGGEEFVLVLPGVGIDRAVAIADEIRLKIAAVAWHEVADGLSGPRRPGWQPDRSHRCVRCFRKPTRRSTRPSVVDATRWFPPERLRPESRAELVIGPLGRHDAERDR